VGQLLYKVLLAPTSTVVVEGPRATSVTATLTHSTSIGSSPNNNNRRTSDASSTSSTYNNNSSTAGGGQSYTVTVRFSGGSTPFYLNATRNTSIGCNGALNNGHTVDFDVSADGVHWVNGTDARVVQHAREGGGASVVQHAREGGASVVQHAREGGGASVVQHAREGGDASASGSSRAESTVSVVFNVMLPSAPTIVRHTGASYFPPCALYNAEGLPAYPFKMTVNFVGR